MLHCPNCGLELQRNFANSGIQWVCPSCKGRAIGMGPLRRSLTRSFVNAVWSSIEDGPDGDRECPICDNAMRQSATGAPVLDVCKRCQIVWFDPREFESAPSLPTQPKLQLTDDQLEPLARAEAEQVAREWRKKGGYELSPEDLLMVPAVLGMPLEEEATVVDRLPWVTWSLCAALLFCGAFSLLNPEFIRDWGLIPALAFRRGGLTFLTSFLLHAGLFQLLSNVYFLVVFGDNVEDFLGRLNYGLLIFVAALVGAGTHAGLSPDRLAPLVGASGGISGIIVFYGLRFPQAKLRYFRLFRWFSMPAIAATGFWAATQFVAVRAQLTGGGETSALVSLGGGAVGLLFWFLWRRD